MPIGAPNDLIDCRRFFLEAVHPKHRQYEALRAYFVEGIPSREVAARFGYTPGSFRVLCHHFRADPTRKFFLPERARQTPPGQPATKTARLRDKVMTLEKAEPVGLRHRRTVGRGGRRSVPAGHLVHPLRSRFPPSAPPGRRATHSQGGAHPGRGR